MCKQLLILLLLLLLLQARPRAVVQHAVGLQLTYATFHVIRAGCYRWRRCCRGPYLRLLLLLRLPLTVNLFWECRLQVSCLLRSKAWYACKWLLSCSPSWHQLLPQLSHD
jgi:hypothetical protein